MLPQRAYAEINLDAICNNIRNVMNKVGKDTKVMAIIKTDAYGHGAVPVAKALAEIGAYAFGVATVDEAVSLRKNGISNPILILGHVFEDDLEKAIKHKIITTVFDFESAKVLSLKAAKLNQNAIVHIKLDTGMGRIGFQPTSKSAEEIIKISKLSNIEINGIFTHFACADEKDKASCNNQKKAFIDFIKDMENSGISFPIKHMCNSAGIIDFDDEFLNMVRSGIMTYGLYPSQEVNKEFKLYPAMQIKSRVAFVKKVGPDFTVSYGSTFKTNKETEIATVPYGYGDGYPRNLSNKGKVLINGQYANIIGRVCMDQFMVDVTGLNVKQNDVVTIVGRDGDKFISVEDVADESYSFNYEFCCRVNMRVPRVYIKDNEYFQTVNYLKNI